MTRRKGTASSSKLRRGEDPRLAQTRDLVLSTAVKLLLNEGLGQLTAFRVHQETGVARTTIYRQWPTQTDLVVATLERLTVPGEPFDDTEDFEADMRTLLLRLKKRMEKRQVRQLVAATLAMAMEDFDHAPLIRSFLNGLLKPIRVRIHREAKRAGMTKRETERLYDRIVAPFMFRHAMMLGTIQPEQVDDVVKQTMIALGFVERNEPGDDGLPWSGTIGT
ncbi:MAG: TetR/AcrR family transcriptional regulator C-terminal ligand-binding domain-containing protein [Myxococcota bacterium]